MKTTWQGNLLWFAAAWNVLGGVTALANPGGHYAAMFSTPAPADSVQQFLYRCVWINVIAWGVGYAIAARVPAARLAVLAAGAAGKTAYALAALAVAGAGTGTAMLALAGVADLVFAGCFVLALRTGASPGVAYAR